MDMVDDATSKTEAGMGKEETIRAAAGILSVWIEKHGVPRALYTDWKNVYKRKPTPAEQLQGEVPAAQFGRMCEKLWDPDHCRQFTRSQRQSGADPPNAPRSSG